MRTLAIETATEMCSVALFEGEPGALSLIEYRSEVLGRGHAERLVPMIAGLPDKGKADRIVVSLGPGSFTGVRIGIAAARALGVAWNAEVLGYPTLALVAAMARDGAASSVSVTMNGGHGQWFVQDFDAAGAPEADVASLPPGEVAALPVSPLIAGNRAKQRAELVAIDAQIRELLPEARHLSSLPASLLSDNLAPIYGRPPDAKPAAR